MKRNDFKDRFNLKVSSFKKNSKKLILIILICFVVVFCPSHIQAQTHFKPDSEALILIAQRYFSIELGFSSEELQDVKLATHVKSHEVADITWVCLKEEHLLLALSEIDKIVYGGWIVATGRNPGQKQRVGDMRTPEGIFRIESIEDARHWGFYEDSVTKERIGYGPYFIRLKTGWKGIGIHGTDEDHLHEIGKNASHGCIRMANDNLLEVVELTEVGQKIVILPKLPQ